MSSVSDTVAAARSPQEAMLALAAGLDLVLAQLAAQPTAVPADPWAMGGEWGAPAVAAATIAGEAAEIEAVQARLAAETDGEERLALEARLRLLTDKGRVHTDTGPAQGTRETYEGGDYEGVVTIPPATPERQAERIAFARAHQLHTFGRNLLPEDEFVAAYAKGGPTWLYAVDRDGVMEMRPAIRRALIEDVMLDSDAAAQEMGRDILKDTSPGTSSEYYAQTVARG